MSSVTVTENNNKVSVDRTTNVVTVTSPGTVGPQGGSGTIDSATATASAVAVSGAGASGTPTVAVTLGGTASARTMAFAFGVPTGASGTIGSVVTTGTDGIDVDSGGTMNSYASTIQLGINAQTLWTHILNANVTGTALTVSDGSNTSPIVLEGTITYAAVANETTVVESAGTVTIGLVDNPVVSGVTAGNVRVGVTADGEIDTSSGNLTLDSAGGTVAVDDNLTVAGNLTVSGSTTTLDSTITTIVDPIIVLQSVAGGGVLDGDTNKDVGLILQYHTGSANKTAFLGYDDSAGKLTFIPDASISSEVISGTVGTMVVDIEGDVTGDVTGTSTLATSFTTSANNGTNETVYPVFVDGATGSQGAETDTGLTYNPSTGMITATGVTATFTGNITGAVTGNAATATALETARTIGGVSFNGTANINLPGVNTAGNQATSGNAATVTTNANLTGDVTSSGNATSIASDVIINADVKSDAAIAMSKTALVGGTGLTLSTNTLNVDAAQTQITSVGTIGTGTWEGTTVAVAQGGTGVTSKTGTGNVVLHTSPTLVTPALGTPASGVMTNATGTASNLTAGTATEATNITAVANNATDETTYPTFVDGATGTQGIETDTGLTYNPSTGALTAAGFTGALTGNASTVTTNANLTGDITSSGNATSIASDVIINSDVKSDAAIAISKTALVGGTGLTLSTNTLSVDAAQTQITSVGTIGTGTWQGTAVAQTYVANQAINEAKMQISNAPTNGQVLTARSGNTGGMTWEAVDADAAGSATAMAIALG
tara:strand:+ start:337 stop:2670 length:2334 start_codon:yes stop_codon:yes gene_type:complete